MEKIINNKLLVGSPLLLTGFMGAGKSFTAFRCVKQVCNSVLYDIDAMIEGKANCSIKEIFNNYGEAEFRKMETLALFAVFADCNHESRNILKIIDAGGGLTLNPDNSEYIKQCILVFLDTDFSIIMERLNIDLEKRPLLIGLSENEIRLMWENRREKYIELADFTINSSKEFFSLIEKLF